MGNEMDVGRVKAHGARVVRGANVGGAPVVPRRHWWVAGSQGGNVSFGLIYS
jgi:hypothetical protein